jgi:hypothetical protein
MGPFIFMADVANKDEWAYTFLLVPLTIKNNGPIQACWWHLPKNKWAHSSLLVASAIKHNGPIQAYWQHLP